MLLEWFLVAITISNGSLPFAHIICFGQYELSYKWQSGDFKDFLVLTTEFIRRMYLFFDTQENVFCASVKVEAAFNIFLYIYIYQYLLAQSEFTVTL